MSDVLIHFEINVICILDVSSIELVEIACNDDIFSTNYVRMIFN